MTRSRTKAIGRGDTLIFFSRFFFLQSSATKYILRECRCINSTLGYTNKNLKLYELMIVLFTVSSLLVFAICCSQYLLFRFNWINLNIINPVLFGWIMAVCSYELLHHAIDALKFDVAISIIFVSFMFTRFIHAFHTHEHIDNNCTVAISSNTRTCDDCEPSDETCKPCDCNVELQTYNSAFKGLNLKTNTIIPSKSNCELIGFSLIKHVAFGLHVLVDSFIIGLSYNTTAFLSLSLTIGFCMIQDTIALVSCLQRLKSARPRIQASVSVSIISFAGICISGLVYIPPLLSSIISCISIGFLAHELTEISLPHVHGLMSIKQSFMIVFGILIAFGFHALQYL